LISLLQCHPNFRRESNESYAYRIEESEIYHNCKGILLIDLTVMHQNDIN
jgi:hypothetical protein